MFRGGVRFGKSDSALAALIREPYSEAYFSRAVEPLRESLSAFPDELAVDYRGHGTPMKRAAVEGRIAAAGG